MTVDVQRLHYKMQKAGLTGFNGVDENGRVSWDHAPSGSEVVLGGFWANRGMGIYCME